MIRFALFICLVGTAYAEVMPDLDALRAALPPCDDVAFGFEDVPFGTFVEALPGARVLASTQGAYVDDEAGGARCRGHRCVRVPVLGHVEVAERPWIELHFHPPVPAFSAWVIDPGVGQPGEVLEVEAFVGDESLERLARPVAADDVDGGVFVGLRFARPVTRVRITAPALGDGFGIDDVWYPPRRCLDLDLDGASAWQGDCDDDDPTRAPGLMERCDGVDNDCDAVVADRELDWDRLGFLACEDPDLDGVSQADGDCDPYDPSRYPGAAEACDGVDNDCDGVVDSAELDTNRDAWLACEDPDGDGQTEAEGDCRPHDPTIWAGAPEICDGLDNDCDGVVPASEHDVDRDGWRACEDPDGDGVTEAKGDCRPHDALSFPGAPEICDGHDNDCDGVIPRDEHNDDRDAWLACEDPDGDGVSEAQGDCRPFDAQSYPGADEICDGLDNDCDGVVPSNEHDADRDGYMACEGDCADDDPQRRPGAIERENGWDDNCDGLSSGGLVGCQTAPAQGGDSPIPTAVIFFALCVLLRWRAPRWRHRALLLLVPVAVVAGGRQAQWIDYHALVAAPEYQARLGESNHGSQFVVQISEEGLERLVLDHLAAEDQLRFHEEDVETCPQLPNLPPNAFCLHFDIDGWVEDLDLIIEADGRIAVTVALGGTVLDDDARLAPSEIGGTLTIRFASQLLGRCRAGDLRLAFEREAVLADDVTFAGVLGRAAFVDGARAQLVAAIEARLNVQPFSLQRGICEGMLNARALALNFEAHAEQLRTVSAAESTSGRAFLMLGYDVLKLPACHVGESTLFAPTSFERFSGDLIEPDRDLAISVSPRLLRAVVWQVMLNRRIDYVLAGNDFTKYDPLVHAESDRLTVSEALAEAQRVMQNKLDWAEHRKIVHWEGTENEAPIEDPREAACDGVTEGSYVLNMQMPDNPRMHVLARVWGKKNAPWPISDAWINLALYGDLRIFPDVRDAERPTLGLELIHWQTEEVSCTASCFGGEQLNDLRTAFAAVDDELTADFGDLVPALRFELGDAVAIFDRFEAWPAALAFSGTLTSNTLGDLRPPPLALPAGTVLGLNVDEPRPPQRADTWDSTQRGCPPGSLSRTFTIDHARFDACVVEQGGDQPLPPGAWCGLALRSDWRAKSASQPRIVEPDCAEEDEADCALIAEEIGCMGVDPRVACPPGFEPLGIWHSAEYARALADGQPRGEAVLRKKADLMTCIADGDANAGDLPGGLVLGGGVVGFSKMVNLPCEFGERVRQPTPFKRPTPLRNAVPVQWPPDLGELQYCTTPGQARDLDADGVSPEREAPAQTDPAAYSTSGDVLPDGFALREGTDPHATDTDCDGLSDFAELIILGSDPLAWDTDGDGLPDGYERYVTNTDPLEFDTDGDGVSDLREEIDPLGPGMDASDADADGLPDGFERWVSCTDPHAPDSDGDGVDDHAQLSIEDWSWYGGEGPIDAEADRVDGAGPGDGG